MPTFSFLYVISICIMKEKIITFIITKDCQLQCRYCYLVGKNSNERMDLSIAKKAIDFILDNEVHFPESSVVIDFIGGEPLLEIDLIEAITLYFISELEIRAHHWMNNYKIRITTNGVLYASSKVQNYINKYKEKLSISISLDGTKEKHDMNRIFQNGKGSYDSIIPNVKLWRKQFPDEGTKMVVSHEDLPYIKDSIVHLIDLDIKMIDVNTVVEDVWEHGDESVFEAQLLSVADYLIEADLWGCIYVSVFDENVGTPITKDDSIPCGSFMLAVDGNGEFYSCLRFAKFSLRNKEARSIGNVYSGINWNKLRPYLLLDSHSFGSEECKLCEVGNGCRWCPAENYDASKTGTIYQRVIAGCKMHKAKVRAKNYYWNKLQNSLKKWQR